MRKLTFTQLLTLAHSKRHAGYSIGETMLYLYGVVFGARYYFIEER